MHPNQAQRAPRAARKALAWGVVVFAASLGAALAQSALAAPTVTRLTPPSELFSTGQGGTVIARFLPQQRFDLQATIRPDGDLPVVAAAFAIDGKPVANPVTLKTCNDACLRGVPKNAAVATVRGVSVLKPGVHEFAVEVVQGDGQRASARGNFEVAPLANGGKKIKNVIILLGDGMGAAHRTAARIVQSGYAQGKALAPLAMDTFPVTGMVKTASLNSIVTDSSPGMAAYVSGNKSNNNEEGVFPDDTIDPFDNPRVEYLSEYLHRTQGKALGIVTTADVFDATPAANAVHTSNRGAGTGIVDQFLDDRGLTGLAVLMGGGRKWFLPSDTPGSARARGNDYSFDAKDAHTGEIMRRWGAAAGKVDPERDLIGDFKSAGFAYAGTRQDMDAVAGKADKLLGLFALSNMNVALDKIDGRRRAPGTRAVVDDYGLPDQPMLDEMTVKALDVLKKRKKGFVLMVEGASIDKQAHNMDSERWILDTIEFDRAVKVAQDFASKDGETLVLVTADHECSGATLIGAARLTDAKLQEASSAAATRNAAALRDPVVGIYEQAGFPRYRTAPDGYPVATNVDFRMLVAYGANSDRYEDWRPNPLPLQDSQQPFARQAPLSTYPANPAKRDDTSGYLVTGQVPGESAVHTATDIPLSAFGPGAHAFTGVIDNTDVFFKVGQLAVGGVLPFNDGLPRRR